MAICRTEFAPESFFVGFICRMLDIVANYHRNQFKEKLMIQTEENAKKPHFGPDLGPLGPKL